MADFTIKRGDTWPPIQATLSDQNGPINLTTATTVKILLKTQGASPTLISHACTITDAPNGKVSYAWIAADTATVNTYQAEWEITWSDGTITTVPNVGYKSVDVVADLG